MKPYDPRTQLDDRKPANAVDPLQEIDTADVDASLLRELLLGGIADLRQRQQTGLRFTKFDIEMLAKLLEMTAEFPALAKAINDLQAYVLTPTAAEGEGPKLVKTTPETMRRIRAVLAK